MRIIIVLLAASMLFSCQKDESENPSTCEFEMKELLADKLTCGQKDFLETNLFVGNYQNKTVYFEMEVCPSCNTAPPKQGYTCEGIKVTFTDFNKNVTGIKQVYNACTNKFTK